MKNAKGFIFPTTMVIVLFSLLVMTYISTAFISEKVFYSETEQYYILENLMQLAVDQSLADIKKGTALDNEQLFTDTINGRYSYFINEISPSIYEVQLSCISINKREYTAKYQYDLEKNNMILWSEY